MNVGRAKLAGMGRLGVADRRLLRRDPGLWISAFNALLSFMVAVGWWPFPIESLGAAQGLMLTLLALYIGQAITPDDAIQELIDASREMADAKDAEMGAAKLAARHAQADGGS